MIVWTLNSNTCCLGVYSSMKNLSKGIDYWMKNIPRQILSYEKRSINYSPEANSWGWCYIPLNTRIKRLTAGGANWIPKKKYWGFNLIDLQLRGVETSEEVKDE